MARRYNEIKGLAECTARMIVSSEEDWKKFLHTAGHMYEKMHELIESIMLNGVLTPVIVRKIENGEYEMISGHRRLFAIKQIGFDTIPAIIKNYSDDEAVLAMVDSNLQREEILPSEKAFAYKMRYDAMKRQGQRNDLTSSQIGNSDMFLFKKKNMYVDENGAYNPPGQHMIILNESLNIMEETVNPSTYFSRYELALKKALYCINEKQAVWNGMNCKQIYKMLSEDKSREMLHRRFIDRLFEANKENRLIFQMDEVGKYMSESTKIYFSERFNRKGMI